MDPYNRVAEISETNNVVTATVTIRTRPDLSIPTITLSDAEPMAGETVTVTVNVRNAGQTVAGTATVALYDGNPDAGGALVGDHGGGDHGGGDHGGGDHGGSPLPGGVTASVAFTWTATSAGPHRLFARADRDHQVAESDEGNNDRWRDVYVGLRGPIAVDSGMIALDRPYNVTLGYGVIETGQTDILDNCGTAEHETYRLDPSGQVGYRFDHLLPGHFYHLDLTLYECGSGASRQERIKVDGNPVAGPEDLGDGKIHRVSVLLDPALYADRTVSVTIEAAEGLGALVNQIALHDVDYRYADSGSAGDPPYPTTASNGLRYGWLDGSPTNAWGTLPYQTGRADLLNNDVRYRFDGLDPLKQYKLRLGFYQGSGTNRVQQVWLDSQVVGPEITLVSGQRYSTTLVVPFSAYADDGSVVASLVRTNATVGALVNEISLEEETQATAQACQVTQTPFWMLAYHNVTIAGQPAPIGTLVTAETPRGEVVGCFTVSKAGQYGFMPIYGEDLTATPPTPGMREEETVIFRINGALAVADAPLVWTDDKAPHVANLATGVTEAQSILLGGARWNLVSFRVEPTVTRLENALSSIAGKFCRVLAETTIYDCTAPERFRTLKDLHGGTGYFIRLDSASSATLQMEGLPITPTLPLPLHAGLNWVGYLPAARLPVTVALQSIAGQYLQVSDGSLTYDPALPDFSTLSQMEPGRGYLIFAKTATTLTYPSAATIAGAPAARREVCPEVAATPFFTLLYGALTVSGQPAAVGTRVETLTPRGELAGCFTVEKPGQYGFCPPTAKTRDPRRSRASGMASR